MMQTTNPLRNSQILLAILFVCSLLAFWPGIVSPDGMRQYAEATSGIYSDHHPPLMSFVWRHLDQVHKGPGLLLLLHLTMLYSAAAVFMLSFKDSLFKWWYAIYPIIPNILSYTPLIVKDVGFAYSYLLAAALLSYLMVKKSKRDKYYILALTLVLLFYGTSVKFQARYLLIFFTLGIGYCIDYKFSKRAIIAGVVLYLALLQAMFSLNNFLVPSQQESHSWQLVKLYDLAAISIKKNQAMFPDFVQQQPNYSFEKVKSLFSPQEVDPLVFATDKVLSAGNTQHERDELQRYWSEVVLENPWAYLEHRFRLWSYNLFSVPSGRSHPADYFKNTSLGQYFQEPSVYRMVGKIYDALNIALQFIWLSPLLVFYVCLSWIKRNKSNYAVPLLMFSLTSCMLLGVLLFCSMAATSRYVFMCVCLLHASHGFAHKSWHAK